MKQCAASQRPCHLSKRRAPSESGLGALWSGGALTGVITGSNQRLQVRLREHAEFCTRGSLQCTALRQPVLIATTRLAASAASDRRRRRPPSAQLNPGSRRRPRQRSAASAAAAACCQSVRRDQRRRRSGSGSGWRQPDWHDPLAKGQAQHPCRCCAGGRGGGAGSRRRASGRVCRRGRRHHCQVSIALLCRHPAAPGLRQQPARGRVGACCRRGLFLPTADSVLLASSVHWHHSRPGRSQSRAPPLSLKPGCAPRAACALLSCTATALAKPLPRCPPSWRPSGCCMPIPRGRCRRRCPLLPAALAAGGRGLGGGGRRCS
jgi:hypothetical protein